MMKDDGDLVSRTKIFALRVVKMFSALPKTAEALMTTCRLLEAEVEHARTHAAHLLQAVLKEAFAPAANVAA